MSTYADEVASTMPAKTFKSSMLAILTRCAIEFNFKNGLYRSTMSALLNTDSNLEPLKAFDVLLRMASGFELVLDSNERSILKACRDTYEKYASDENEALALTMTSALKGMLDMIDLDNWKRQLWTIHDSVKLYKHDMWVPYLVLDGTTETWEERIHGAAIAPGPSTRLDGVLVHRTLERAMTFLQRSKYERMKQDFGYGHTGAT